MPSESADRDRSVVLEYAAALERLREKLPGWVSREMIVDDSGTAAGFWPAAIVKFTLVTPVAVGEGSGEGSTAELIRPEKPKDEKMIAAAWWVRGNSDRPHLIYLSAGKYDRYGFRIRQLAETSSQTLVEKIQIHWSKRDVTLVNEFTLLTTVRLEKMLLGRLLKKIKPETKIEPDNQNQTVKPDSESQLPPVPWIYTGRCNQFRIIEPHARSVARADQEVTVYKGVTDQPKIDHLKRLLIQSVDEMPADTRALGLNASKIDEFFKVGDATLSIYGRPTSFYPGYTLYRMVRGTVEAYVVAPDWESLPHPAAGIMPPQQGTKPPALILTGLSHPIRNFNMALGNEKRIEEETATDYLSFFCKFVHGEEGAFLVLKSAADFHWKDFPKIDNVRKNIVGKFAVGPSTIQVVGNAGGQSDDKFHRLATVNYGHDMFLARFEITSEGSIVMEESHWLYRNLPIQPFKFDKQRSWLVDRKQG